jgi:hypothetical protein
LNTYINGARELCRSDKYSEERIDMLAALIIAESTLNGSGKLLETIDYIYFQLVIVND